MRLQAVIAHADIYGESHLLRTYFAGFVGFLARNAAPDVKRDVAMPVGPAYSMSTKPVFVSMFRGSRTGIAPPIQSDQASRLLATSWGRS